MAEQKFATSEQVEEEIQRLLACPEVKLAKVEQRVRNRRRQYMYALRCLERRGKELMRMGITEEELNHEATALDAAIKEEEA